MNVVIFHVISTFPLYEFSEKVLDSNFWGEKCFLSTFVLIWTSPCNIHPLSRPWEDFLRGFQSYFLEVWEKMCYLWRGVVLVLFILWGIVNLKKCILRSGGVAVNMEWPFLLISSGIRRYYLVDKGVAIKYNGSPFLSISSHFNLTVAWCFLDNFL